MRSDESCGFLLPAYYRLVSASENEVPESSAPEEQGADTDTDTHKHVIDIFMMSVKCGNCDTYQTVVGFKKYPEKNVYTYECENEICDPNVTRTIVEVPKEVDNSVKRAEELPYYEKEEAPEE